MDHVHVHKLTHHPLADNWGRHFKLEYLDCGGRKSHTEGPGQELKSIGNSANRDTVKGSRRTSFQCNPMLYRQEEVASTA